MNREKLKQMIAAAAKRQDGLVFEVDDHDGLDYPFLIVIVPIRRMYFVRIIDDDTDVQASKALRAWAEAAGRLGISGGFFVRSEEDVSFFDEFLIY